MSSRPGHPTHTTTAPPPAGRAERAQRAGRGARTAGPDRHDPSPERYEPYIDGLFTYCLSVLCEHDAATEVLGEVLALAERQHGRRPSDPGLYRPWLYALARWACLRRLADPGAPQGPAVAEESDRRRELSALAWPEAAGATPEQREALELSVRHGLGSRELAAVLGMEPVAARALLSTAACEVERTRAALLVAETGRCLEVARPAGDGRMLLSTALLRELVRHVDACDECRRTAERATAGGPWPGTEPVAQGPLPLVTAPRAAARVAMRAALRSRTGRAVELPEKGAQGRTKRAVGVNGSAPRYDRSGFPLGPKDRAARNARLRSRALTTTVVATVVAAPVLALWAAYRGAPLTGETDGTAVTAGDSEGDRIGGRPYEKAGSAQLTPDPRFRPGVHTPDVSVEVIGTRERPGEARPSPSRSRSGPGRLTVAAQPSGDLTVITLAASGGTAVRWAAHTGAPWLQFSTTAGVLQPGETTSIRVYVDRDREPAGYWRARVSVEPAGAVITIEGRGATRPAPGGPRPTPSAPPSSPAPTPTPSPSDPSPSDPPPSDPTPSPTPTQSDPPPSDPPPSPSDTASPSG